MCLNKLDQITIHAESGYKAFIKNHIGIIGRHYGGPYETDVWIDDKNNWDIHDYDGNFLYHTGFHVYICDKEKLEKELGGGLYIFEIEIKNIIASGIEYINDIPFKIVVARKMKIKGGRGMGGIE